MTQLENHAKQLMMFRAAAPVPEIPMPPGWAIRSMVPGEGAMWSFLVRAAGFFTDTAESDGELWERVMGSDAMMHAENVFFCCDNEDRPVATASARFVPVDQLSQFPPAAGGLGCLHFVAALPKCRGVGAGSAVTAAVLNRFEELGLHCCVLATDDFRLPAIKSYLRLGWIPVLYAPDMHARWAKVLVSLGHTGSFRAVQGDGTETPVNLT